MPLQEFVGRDDVHFLHLFADLTGQIRVFTLLRCWSIVFMIIAHGSWYFHLRKVGMGAALAAHITKQRSKENGCRCRCVGGPAPLRHPRPRIQELDGWHHHSRWRRWLSSRDSG